MKCFLKESLFALGNPDVTNHHSIMGNNQKKNCPNPAHYFDHNFTISHIFSKYFSPLVVCVRVWFTTKTGNLQQYRWTLAEKSSEYIVVDDHPFFYTKRVSHNPVSPAKSQQDTGRDYQVLSTTHIFFLRKTRKYVFP